MAEIKRLNVSEIPTYELNVLGRHFRLIISILDFVNKYFGNFVSTWDNIELLNYKLTLADITAELERRNNGHQTNVGDLHKRPLP